VGTRIARSFRRVERIYTKGANIGESIAGSNTNPVYFSNSHDHQWCPHTRKRGIERGQEDVASGPNIFHVQSFDMLKNVIFINGEDMLCCSHEYEKVATLFRSS
jgi:hypothetical protein